jgi:hypothetical protein
LGKTVCAPAALVACNDSAEAPRHDTDADSEENDAVRSASGQVLGVGDGFEASRRRQVLHMLRRHAAPDQRRTVQAQQAPQPRRAARSHEVFFFFFFLVLHSPNKTTPTRLPIPFFLFFLFSSFFSFSFLFLFLFHFLFFSAWQGVLGRRCA